MKEKVLRVLDTLRPTLAAEGGNLELVEMAEDGTAVVRMKGLCRTCDASLWTHRLRIERAMKEALPDIKVAVQI
jgi:Fe-S cluster biogenesis protein NfuA